MMASALVSGAIAALAHSCLSEGGGFAVSGSRKSAGRFTMSMP